MDAPINGTDNIISCLYGYANKQHLDTSKSFNEFWNDRIFDITEDTFFIFGENFIVFQNARPHLLADILLHNIDRLTPKIFYEISKKAKDLHNLIALFFWKAITGTEIKIINKEKTHQFEFTTVYKERKRGYTEVNDDDFTHHFTITYRHPTTWKHPIFIMNYNTIIREMVNIGFQRLRSYVLKMYNDKLKRKIKDKEKRLELANKLKEENFKYVKVYEIHQNGFIHVHVLIKLPPEIRRRDFREIIRLLARQFNTEEIGIDLKRIKKDQRRKAHKYVNKYLEKGFYSDTNLSYTTDEDGKVYYLIRKEAFYSNDIPRLSSHSRNCIMKRRVKTQRCKNARELTDTEEDLRIKEKPFNFVNAERIKLPIAYQSYGNPFVKNDVDKFKRLKAKREAHRQIRIAEKRNKAIEILEKYINGKINVIDSIVLNNNDEELKKVINAIDFIKRDDREIKKHHEDLIIEASRKLKKDLFIIDIMPPPTPEKLRTQQQEEETEWIDF